LADFCSRCGKTLSLIDPLLELKGLRFCEDCYPDVKREHAATSMSEKMDKRQRVAFADDDTDENLRGSIIKGKQALALKETEFKWDNPSLSDSERFENSYGAEQDNHEAERAYP